MRSRLHRSCKMNKKRYQPDVESATGKTPRRMFVGLASNAAGNSPTVLRRRLRNGNGIFKNAYSTPKKNASAGTSHNAPPKDPGTPASPADKKPPGNNASSPSTLLGDTSPPITPTGTKHTHCIHCAKQLHNPGAIVYCDAQFDTSSKPTVQCWRCATDNQQCIPIPIAYRKPVNQAIALRETIDEQQRILDRAMARRNAANKALKELLSYLPAAAAAAAAGTPKTED
ncbi:MAG: hypothetical protein L6R36_000474 [Xanthoria steineri]|nr:MAG: hypothetical protein L6R36_000474 [Xanthoria steineri]